MEHHAPATTPPRKHGLPAVRLTVLLIVSALPLRGQESAVASQPDSPSLRVTAQWDTSAYLGSRSTLVFELSRELGGGERLAVMVGATDVSGALRVRGRRVEYDPTVRRLPAGTAEAVAYLIGTDGDWQDVGHLSLNVRTRAGLERASATPGIDFSSAGQLAQYVPDDAQLPGEKARQDLTLRLGLQGKAQRDGWEVSLQSNAVGVSEKTQRLRWADRAERAPTLDLVDYQVQARREHVRVALGNVAVGANRYLVSGFGSRGAIADVTVSRVLSLDAAAVGGTNIVGWDNLLGFGAAKHRLLSAGLKLELVPSRPGAAHVDVQALDGAVRPLTGFTQGAVTDAERSRGVGVQVALSDARQRLQLSAGVTQSRFDNPTDPLLGGDTAIVAVRQETRRARFGELQLQLLRDRSLFGTTRASMGTVLRHERVDPLYRSVAAYVQGDQQQDGADVTANVGALSILGTYARTRDNLADIPSILTTRTQRRTLSLAAPLNGFLGLAAVRWLPVASFSWDATHQAGDGVPENGDFAASHVPDQFSRVRSASVAWTPALLSITYRWNESLQDNRQPGREQADFRTRVHSVQLGLTGTTRFTVAIDGSVERLDALENGTQQRTSRVGTVLQGQLTRTLSLSANAAHTWGFDPYAERHTQNLELQGELSQGFTLYRAPDGGTQGRVFVRYARTRARFFPLLADPSLPAQLMWSVNAGSSIRFF